MQVVFMVVALAFSFVIYYVLFHTLSTVLREDVTKLVIVMALYGSIGYGLGVLFLGNGMVLASIGAFIGSFLGYHAYIK